MSNKIPAVRILPISADKKRFVVAVWRRCNAAFSWKSYPRQNGTVAIGILLPDSAEPGTVVLFQYAGSIIASAIFDRNERLTNRRAITKAHSGLIRSQSESFNLSAQMMSALSGQNLETSAKPSNG